MGRDLDLMRRSSLGSAHRVAKVMKRWAAGPLPENDRLACVEAHRARWAADKRSFREAGIPHDDKHTISRACRASKPARWAALLHELVIEFQPQVTVELGTNLGISSAYLADAAAGYGGIVWTLDGAAGRMALARQMHEECFFDNVRYHLGTFRVSLPEALARIDTIDMAFIDGHHQYKPTLDYFDWIYPKLADGAIVVFDDIRWSDGMRRAWSELQEDPRFEFLVEHGNVGITSIRKQVLSEPGEFYKVWVSRW